MWHLKSNYNLLSGWWTHCYHFQEIIATCYFKNMCHICKVIHFWKAWVKVDDLTYLNFTFKHLLFLTPYNRKIRSCYHCVVLCCRTTLTAKRCGILALRSHNKAKFILTSNAVGCVELQQKMIDLLAKQCNARIKGPLVDLISSQFARIKLN